MADGSDLDLAPDVPWAHHFVATPAAIAMFRGEAGYGGYPLNSPAKVNRQALEPLAQHHHART